MRSCLGRNSSWTCLAAAWLIFVTGCGDPAKSGTTKESVKPKDGVAKASTKHTGWWCTEHGIPEAECSMCSSKVEAECKKNGDWCQMHNRAKSQCFICDPKLKEKYAAVYRAKMGKEPPPTEDEEAPAPKTDVKK